MVADLRQLDPGGIDDIYQAVARTGVSYRTIQGDRAHNDLSNSLFSRRNRFADQETRRPATRGIGLKNKLQLRLRDQLIFAVAGQ
jgi:hypothetical protein